MEIKEKAIQKKNNKASGIALLVDDSGEGIEEWFHPSPNPGSVLCGNGIFLSRGCILCSCCYVILVIEFEE